MNKKFTFPLQGCKVERFDSDKVDGSIEPILTYASQLRKASPDVASSVSVDDSMKGVDESMKQINEFIVRLMKEKSMKPFAKKLKADFQRLMVDAKPTLQMAAKLEKNGEKNSKKQLAAFRLKLTVR